MDDAKDFLVLRYSLIEESQATIDSSPLPHIKGKSILAAISGDKEFSHNNVRYSFVGFHLAEPAAGQEFPRNRIYIGKTAKLRKTHVGEKIPGDIVEHNADDWIPVITIFDVIDQYIFVQKDWRFGDENQTCRAIESGLRYFILAQYNHLVFVEPKTKKEYFWRIIRDSKRVYKIQLDLISPNILETNRRARDALAALEDIFNQKEVKIILENESGDLSVPQEPLSDYVDYIAEGEGSWKITTEGTHGGKKTHRSSEQTETIELPVPNNDIDNNGLQVDMDDPPASMKIGYSEKIAAAVFTHVARNLRRKNNG